MDRQAKASSGTQAFARPDPRLWGTEANRTQAPLSSLTALAVLFSGLGRLQHGDNIEGGSPERVAFEKVSESTAGLGLRWIVDRTTWGRREGLGEPAHLSGEHHSRLPLLELHSALHGGNFRFSSSARLPASAPWVTMASTRVSSGVGRPSAP